MEMVRPLKLVLDQHPTVCPNVLAQDVSTKWADRLLLRVSVPPLKAGVYKVEWRVMSTDTHKVNGNFSFTVGE